MIASGVIQGGLLPSRSAFVMTPGTFNHVAVGINLLGPDARPHIVGSCGVHCGRVGVRAGDGSRKHSELRPPARDDAA